jgi:hypothetical protein
MNLSSWLKRFLRSPRRARRGPGRASRPRSFRPVVEQLEARTLFAAGLVAYYTFESGPPAPDVSGNGNTAAASANPPTLTSAGFQGSAYQFNETGPNYLVAPFDVGPTAMPQVTMGGWFKVSDLGVTDGHKAHYLFSDGNGGGDRALVTVLVNGQQYWASHSGGNGNVLGAQVVPDQWIFVAVRYDQTTNTGTLDVNGTLTSFATTFGASVAHHLNIGRNPTYGRPYDGLMDNVFVFNQALTDAQLNAIQQQGGVSQAPQFTDGPPPSFATVGVPYPAFTYTATGSPAPTFRVTSGALPPGLNLDPGGALFGTPTTAGTFTGIVTASNGVTPDATQPFRITVSASRSPFAVSVAFDHAGNQVTEVVTSTGDLFQYDVFGVHHLAGGVLSVGLAFDPAGRQVTDIVFANGDLYQYDVFGVHRLIGGALSVGVAFDPLGHQVTDIVFASGDLYQYDLFGVHRLIGGAQAVSVAFDAVGHQVTDIVFASGDLYQYDVFGVHHLLAGVQSVGVTFDPTGHLVTEVFLPSGALDQYDRFGIHFLGVF